MNLLHDLIFQKCVLYDGKQSSDLSSELLVLCLVEIQIVNNIQTELILFLHKILLRRKLGV